MAAGLFQQRHPLECGAPETGGVFPLPRPQPHMSRRRQRERQGVKRGIPHSTKISIRLAPPQRCLLLITCGIRQHRYNQHHNEKFRITAYAPREAIFQQISVHTHTIYVHINSHCRSCRHQKCAVNHAASSERPYRLFAALYPAPLACRSFQYTCSRLKRHQSPQPTSAETKFRWHLNRKNMRH